MLPIVSKIIGVFHGGRKVICQHGLSLVNHRYITTIIESFFIGYHANKRAVTFSMITGVVDVFLIIMFFTAIYIEFVQMVAAPTERSLQNPVESRKPTIHGYCYPAPYTMPFQIHCYLECYC